MHMQGKGILRRKVTDQLGVLGYKIAADPAALVEKTAGHFLQGIHRWAGAGVRRAAGRVGP